MDKKEKIKSEEIKTTEDKVRLTLKEYKEIHGSLSIFFTYIGFLVSFLVPLFTSTFNDVWIFKANIINGIFIVLSVIAFILSVIESIKIIKNKIKGNGDEDWFVYRIQGKNKPRKQKKKKNVKKSKFSFSDIDWVGVIKFIITFILYILPLGLWVLVISLIGWGNAWNTQVLVEGNPPNWVPTLIFSCVWLLGTYFGLIVYSSDIIDFIDDIFDRF